MMLEKEREREEEAPPRASQVAALYPLVAVLTLAVGVSLAVVVGPLVPLGLLALGLIGWILLRPGSDVVTLLTAFIIILFAVPSQLVVGPLESMGSPGLLMGLLCFVLWAAGRVLPWLSSGHGLQPLRIALLVFAAANLASYGAAQLRRMPFVEMRAADRGMVMTLSMIGIGLLACDGIATRERLQTLIRRLIIAGAALATAGILTAAFGIDIAGGMSVPGLRPLEGSDALVQVRSDLLRVKATTTHAIEFSVVLAMLLPLAVQQGFNATRRKAAWWAAAGLIGASIPLSLARSGVLGLVAAAVMILPTMSRERRRVAYVGAVVYVVVIRLLFPGVLGTLRALFTYAGNDPSVAGRTEDYGYIGSFFGQSPIFGRGFFTFIPSLYDYIDNQYLVALVETGIIGVLALIGLFVCGMSAARGARRRSDDTPTRDLAQALTAAIFVALITCATFDFLSFGTARGVLFLLLGAAGAIWRLEREGGTRRAGVTVTSGSTVARAGGAK